MHTCVDRLALQSSLTEQLEELRSHCRARVGLRERPLLTGDIERSIGSLDACIA